jgi:hypothetical protein
MAGRSIKITDQMMAEALRKLMMKETTKEKEEWALPPVFGQQQLQLQLVQSRPTYNRSHDAPSWQPTIQFTTKFTSAAVDSRINWQLQIASVVKRMANSNPNDENKRKSKG